MQDKTKETKFSYESMGTKWEISIWDLPQGGAFGKLKEEIIAKSTEFDETYSRFKPTSVVSKISESTGSYEVPADFLNMLKMYWDLYEKSERKLNPLIGFTISDLGYDADYSLKEKKIVRKVPDLFETISLEDAIQGKITTKEKVLFDFGALGKGYFVDKIAEYLKGEGVERFLVNGSGDIYYYDKSNTFPISAGLEDPGDQSKIIGKVNMVTGAMCASGINRRKWFNRDKNLNHVIDPHTLESQEEIVATWVTASTCALSDALASCLFFCPPENFIGYTFDYLIMNNKRQVKKSEGLKVELY